MTDSGERTVGRYNTRGKGAEKESDKGGHTVAESTPVDGGKWFPNGSSAQILSGISHIQCSPGMCPESPKRKRMAQDSSPAVPSEELERYFWNQVQTEIQSQVLFQFQPQAHAQVKAQSQIQAIQCSLKSHEMSMNQLTQKLDDLQNLSHLPTNRVDENRKTEPERQRPVQVQFLPVALTALHEGQAALLGPQQSTLHKENNFEKTFQKSGRLFLNDFPREVAIAERQIKAQAFVKLQDKERDLDDYSLLAMIDLFKDDIEQASLYLTLERDSLGSMWVKRELAKLGRSNQDPAIDLMRDPA